MPDNNQRIHVGNIDNTGEVNIAGGDVYKSIQNIVIVGQFLDFAQIKHLLPKSSQNVNFTDIEMAFKAEIKQHGVSIAEAVSQAGEIIKEIFQPQIIHGDNSVFVYQQFIREIAPPLIQKLKALKHWDRFHKIQNGIVVTFDGRGVQNRLNGQVIWLESLHELRKNQGVKEKNYGLALVSVKDKNYPFFVVDDKIIQQAYNPLILNFQEDRNCDFSTMSENDFRLFITGLLLDLIRLCSQAQATSRFLQRLLGIFGRA